jgi:hypothetical protein
MLGKTNKKTNIDEATTAKVNQELIVHNMPIHSFAKVSPATTISGSQFLSANGKQNNHQTVGIIIVSLGILLVGALIYLSYRFIIKPAAQTPVVATTTMTTQTPVAVVETPAPLVATSTASTTAIMEIEPSVVDLINNSNNLATSTASSTTPETIPVETPPLLDTDADGLTDDEEIALGTNISLPDSDGDSYGDLSELGSGYNPGGPDKLSASSYLTKYQNQTGKYEIYYPASWTLKSLNNDYATLISAPDNSLMQISLQDNPNIQSISAWYGATFPEETLSSNRLQKGIGWEGIMGEDGLNFYLTDTNRENIYIISYIPALSDRLAYPNIFKMIINSFRINK